MKRWLIAAGAGALLAATVGWRADPAADGCESRCYRAKSEAYQSCRRISAADREARERCFRKADAALQRCLRGCKQ